MQINKHTMLFLAGSIWQAIVRAQISEYSLKASSSRTPLKVAEIYLVEVSKEPQNYTKDSCSPVQQKYFRLGREDISPPFQK